MKKKFKKPGLSLDTDEQPDPLAQSTYTRIDHEGLKFIKDDIKVSKEGLSKISGGEELNKYLAVKKEDLDFGDLLGVGAAGQVQQAIYKPLDEPVAVKNINIYDQAKRHQLMNDIRLLLQIKNKSELEYQSYCPFIVKMFGAFYDEGSVKVVLELMDCGSLLDALNKLKVSKTEGPYFEEPVLAKITQQILNGLMFLHVVSHQMHRDIKPANILINSKGEVKLTDFGIGKELDQTYQFASTFRGTQTYMSPERLDGLPYNHLGDIWSVGVMLIELATGKYPYPHGNFIEMREYINNKPTPNLPSGGSYSAEFQDFIEQTLTKNYKKRPSAIELMRHPWILKNNQLEVDLEEWVKVNNLKNKSKVKKMEVIQEGDQEFYDYVKL